jgi:hypothetical protein
MHAKPYQNPNLGCRAAWVTRAVAVAAALITVVAAGACSVTDRLFESPREKMVRSVNEKCDTVNDRFAKDLAYGTAIGADDAEKVRERVALVEDLQSYVRTLPPPESATDQANLDAWLSLLEAYAEELNTMRNEVEGEYRPGADLLLALTANVVKERAKEAGAGAKRLGFDSCARAEGWEYIAPG